MPRVPLSQLSDWAVVHEEQELRGLRLQDEAGHTLGLIVDMIVDTDEGYVDSVVLDTGQELPAEDVEIAGGVVVLRGSGVPQQAGADASPTRARSGPAVSERPRDRGAENPDRARPQALQRAGGRLLEPFVEGAFEVRARALEVQIGKQAYVVEEIRVGKEIVERTETIQESVRETEVNIQELPTQTGSARSRDQRRG